MTKFLTSLYPLLSGVLIASMMHFLAPAIAIASPACRQAHPETRQDEQHLEILFHEDEIMAQMKAPDFSRAVYPPSYFEKYQHRMSPRHKLYAFHHLYLPQFLNVPSSYPRRLKGSFLAFDFQKPAPAIWDQHLNFILTPHFYPVEIIWRGEPNDPVFPSAVIPGISVKRLGFLPAFLRSSTLKVRQLIESSLDRIYQSFANQGPERKILVPIVQEQDTRDLDRTTHFEYGILNIDASVKQEKLAIDEVAHMQIITSTGPEQPFHFEEQWGKIDRVPGEVWGEAGRFILKHWEILNPESQSQVPREELKSIKFRLLHKGFAWANNDARLDRMFLQVNDRVRGILLEMGWPLAQAEAIKKVQEINGETTQEWLFSLNKDQMTEIEKRMLKNLMAVYFNKFNQTPSGRWLKMSFDSNEIKTLIKLGVVRFSDTNVTPISEIQGKNGESLTLQSLDPTAPAVFTLSPDHMDHIEQLSLYFSNEMIQKLMSQWKISST